MIKKLLTPFPPFTARWAGRLLAVAVSVVLISLASCQDPDDPLGDGDTPSQDSLNTISRELPVMYVRTRGGVDVTSRETYIPCTISVDGKGVWPNYSPQMETDSIRGRGNSTWLWYEKKPFKLKTGRSHCLAGVPGGHLFVLLANYRDPTHLMNAVAFDMARYMGLPFTCTNQYVELYLNDAYQGLYQLTEQLTEGQHRVNCGAHGVLISLDFDDGPDESPRQGDNFYSEVYNSSYSWRGLPVCVKYPENPTKAQLRDIRDDFIELEELISQCSTGAGRRKPYDALSERLDVQSMFDFLIIQEMTQNVELVTPRSMYMYRTEDMAWHFGPVWDFDGGFAYDWGENHGYFRDQHWLMGPNHNWHIPDFFDGMFQNTQFLADYKARWDEVHDDMLEYVLDRIDCYARLCGDAMQRDADRWPISKDYDSEITRLRSWLTDRFDRYTIYLKSWK